ncbi:MAG TPA: flagellar basal body L-ring protein FlgH [bacterium]|nr:flagellar basal body L-ring protein FlgH [Candidatus Omnitrophota bacterium]HOJ60225.1 flagellar basal body L-ring protein FlgH [bacterium]HOL94022.1 flagellar basal body L-ring protein FlgH [bacterium]HPO99994.1 flagellar basal body L-ring protein FlgH [bacterium]HXK93262.1 flagellar basal body L-ring protein FlgH [bacterium]
MKRIPLITLSILMLLGMRTSILAYSKSLWTEDSAMNFMLSGANAHKVGDILTILVQEDNRANDSADGESAREHKFNGILGTIWNNPFMDKAFGGADNGPRLKFDSTNEFNGNAAVDRSNRFTSRVAATIVRIDPAGNFLIEARKTIRVGEEHKTIVLSGKVRPRDIINNTVYSYQVADAEISYLGDGTLSKMSNPSFIQRFFNFLF